MTGVLVDFAGTTLGVLVGLWIYDRYLRGQST